MTTTAPRTDKKPARRQSPGQYGTGSVYERSDGKWVGAFTAGYNLQQTPRRITVIAATERECRRKMDRRKGDIARNGIPDPGLTARSTVKAWAEKWLDMLLTRSIRPKTYTAYKSSVNVWIIPTIGHRKLAGLTPDHIRSVAQAITASGGSSTNALHAHRVLMLMLKAAIIEGHPVPHRVLLTGAPPVAVNDRMAIPLDESKALLRVAIGEADASRWIAALLCGLRQGECLGLTWDRVDFANRVIDVSWQLQRLTYLDRAAGTFRVPPGYESRHLYKGFHLVRPKSARGTRLIPMVGPMAEALLQWKARSGPSPHDLVWPSLETGPRKYPGRPRSSKEDEDAWYALQDRSGIRHPAGRRYVLHELRHGAATLLLEGGIDPETVKHIMGHSSITTSRSYMTVSTDLARRALEGGAERLGLNL